uniref:ASCH domain-containing protein n=1 Tax=Fibrocapsa japonica TaxID=94617 RepID=A0A7S2XVX9_9STRA|mmetsp:Transcript_13818/g.20360  ORF Transcript_13818/g.20360 Transcript_13818/m.20360 type:complete len:185 (+) Transcript_13818:8-562(+)
MESSGRSRRKKGGAGGGSSGNHCLTLHQPWASLMVYGIKRVEGRSWATNHRGRLWIHAASHEPSQEEIEQVEQQYRQIYEAMEGVEEVKFPPKYPTSCLLGCVDIADCISQERLQSHENLPESAKMESMSPYCFLAENPQRLMLPFQLSGQHKIWVLDGEATKAAKAALQPVEGPCPIPFSSLV